MPWKKLESSGFDSNSIDDLVARAEEIPWFENVGKPTESDAVNIVRIYRWEDWPGPEDRCVAVVHEIQQTIYDQLIADAGQRRITLLSRWNRVLEGAMSVLFRRFPATQSEDCYHGLTNACWHAAWTTALIDLHGQLNRAVPVDLLEKWAWFTRGHWPYGYAQVDEEGKIGLLAVF